MRPSRRADWSHDRQQTSTNNAFKRNRRILLNSRRSRSGGDRQCGMTKRPAIPMAKITRARIESRPRRATHGWWRMITPKA